MRNLQAEKEGEDPDRGLDEEEGGKEAKQEAVGEEGCRGGDGMGLQGLGVPKTQNSTLNLNSKP